VKEPDEKNKQINHYVASFSDISSCKAAEEEIKQLAFYDPLNQMPNRRLLQERLKHDIEIDRRESKRMALLMLDLDRFKAVNDNWGHLAGDELLQQVAIRITPRQARLDAGLPPLSLSVNISAQQFQRSDINALVATTLHETGFPAAYLELEMTENGLSGSQNKVMALPNKLHAQGIRLAIDDFGTGFSSLACLKHFPLDELKIDKSFIDDISCLSDDMEIAATVIAMGHILGFKVLAEGVETPEQLAFLQEKNCDLFQGYIKSPPVPAEAFAELLREQRFN